MSTRVKCAKCKGIGAPWNNSSSVPCTDCNGLGHIEERELLAECLSRVELMASGDPTWDLSDNDKYALGVVLGGYKGLREMLIHETRHRNEKPDFATFVDLKHGVVGTILWALQNGEISRGKAAEALAEVAHGATEVRLPEVPDAIPEDVTPLELWKRVQELEAAQK